MVKFILFDPKADKLISGLMWIHSYIIDMHIIKQIKTFGLISDAPHFLQN